MSFNYIISTAKSETSNNLLGVFPLEEIYDKETAATALVTPTVRDLCFNEGGWRRTIVTFAGGIAFRDIRAYRELLATQNLAYLRTLFVNDYHVEDGYKDIFNELINAREAIARYNPNLFLGNLKNIAEEKFDRHLIDATLPFGYNERIFLDLIKMEYIAKHYYRGDSFEDCLNITGSYKEFIDDFNANPCEREKAQMLAIGSLKSIRKYHEQNLNKDINYGVKKFLDECILEIMRRGMCDELVRDGRLSW